MRTEGVTALYKGFLPAFARYHLPTLFVCTMHTALRHTRKSNRKCGVVCGGGVVVVRRFLVGLIK